MKEIVLSLGAQRLIGILAVPQTVDPRRPVVLIPNTGIEHRVGPNRLHVVMARAFAQQGYATLRLDLSGMGDSPSGDGGGAVQDLQSAMDEVQRQGYGGRFAAVGLCSGAHDVHRLALADQRVVAAACLDGYVYRTPRFAWTYLQQRLADPQRIFRSLARRLSARGASAPIDAGDVDYFRQPERRQMRLDLALLMRRGVSLCYVYTGQLQYIYNYAAQFTDAFPELKIYAPFELHHMAHADHTFTTVSMRDGLVQCLLGWLRKTQQLPEASPLPLISGAVAAA